MERLIKRPMLEKAQVSRELHTRGQAQGQLCSWVCAMVAFSHRQEHGQASHQMQSIFSHFPKPRLLYCKPRYSSGPRTRLSPHAVEPSPAPTPHLASGRLGFGFASSSTSAMLCNTPEGHWGAVRCSAAAGWQGGTGLSPGNAPTRVSLHSWVNFPLWLRKIRI